MLHFTAHHQASADLAKPALVILHGMFGAGDNWLGIARDLGAERRVFTVDLPGHGESATLPGDRPFHYTGLSRALAESLPGLVGDEASILCGHSMGGKVAMALALRYPGVVAGLIVADTAPFSYVDSGFNTDVLAMLGQVDPSRAAGRMELDAAMKPFIADAVMRGFLLKSLVPLGGGGYRWRFDAPAILAGARDIADWPEEFVSSPPFSGPAVFIRGELSPYVVPGRDLPAINRLFPDSRITEIQGARHWVHFDNKAEFVSLVREFMA